MQVSALLTRASRLLFDQARQHWTEPELIDGLNDGAREIVMVKPTANAVSAAIAMVAGTRQAIPDGDIQFLRAIRNMGADKQTPGAAVTPGDWQAMDAFNPNWHMDTAADEVVHWFYDDRDPRHFYCWPPNTGKGSLEIVDSAAPVVVTDPNDPLPLPDIYANALLSYLLYRAWSKASKDANSQKKAADAYTMMLNSLGIFDRAQASVDARRPALVPLVAGGKS